MQSDHRMSKTTPTGVARQVRRGRFHYPPGFVGHLSPDKRTLGAQTIQDLEWGLLVTSSPHEVPWGTPEGVRRARRRSRSATTGAHHSSWGEVDHVHRRSHRASCRHKKAQHAQESDGLMRQQQEAAHSSCGCVAPLSHAHKRQRVVLQGRGNLKRTARSSSKSERGIPSPAPAAAAAATAARSAHKTKAKQGPRRRGLQPGPQNKRQNMTWWEDLADAVTIRMATCLRLRSQVSPAETQRSSSKSANEGAGTSA